MATYLIPSPTQLELHAEAVSASAAEAETAAAEAQGYAAAAGQAPNLAFDPLNRLASSLGLSATPAGRARYYNPASLSLVAAGTDPNNPYATPTLRHLGAGDVSAGRIYYLDEMGVAAGDVVSAAVHAHVPAGTVTQLAVHCRSAAGAVLSSTYGANSVGSGVQTLRVEGVAVPIGTVSVQVRLERQGGTTSDVDTFAWGFWKGALARPWVDNTLGDALATTELVAVEKSRTQGVFTPASGYLSAVGPAVLSVQLSGIRNAAKNYVVDFLSRGNGAGVNWRIIVSAYDPGVTVSSSAARVCEFNVSANPEPTGGIGIHALTALNGSGITGTVVVDWAKLTVGAANLVAAGGWPVLTSLAWVRRDANDAATLGGQTAAQIVAAAGGGSATAGGTGVFTAASSGPQAAQARALFLDVQLFGPRVAGKDYGFEYIRRGAAGVAGSNWRIILNQYDAGTVGTNSVRVAELNTTVSPEAAAGLPTTMLIPAINGSGISARVVVDWTQWAAGFAYSTLYHMVLEPVHAWVQRQGLSEQGAPSVVLPRKVYALLGGLGAAIEELNLYFSNFVTGPLRTRFVDVVAGYGRQYADFWRLQPGNTAEPKYNVAAGTTVPLTVQVQDGQLGVLASTGTTVEVVSKAAATPVRLLCIGDSMTRATPGYSTQVQTTLAGVQTVGTRTLDSGTTNTEGRGGWTLAQYVRTAAGTATVDSPFLFPSGVAGGAYWGNVAFWKAVTATDPGGYDYDGFQRVARGWASSGAYQFDATGYPTAPAIGDVVYDPAKAAGARFLQWSGSAWVAMAAQPTLQLDFGKYMARYAAAFSAGAPTHISILFGANDFQASAGIGAGISQWITDLTALITSIRTYSATVKIILGLPITGAPQDAWGISQGAGQTAAQYNRNMQQLSAQILAQWDTDAALAAGISVCPFILGVDPVYGFDSTTEAANKYVATLVTRYNNYVHPNPAGYKQMGDVLAAVVQKTR